MLRPDPVPRNWRPGETLEELFAENAQHAIHPPEALALPAGEPGDVHTVMDIEDQVVVGGALLPAIEQLRAAVGAGHSVLALTGAGR